MESCKSGLCQITNWFYLLLMTYIALEVTATAILQYSMKHYSTKYLVSFSLTQYAAESSSISLAA